MALRNKIVAGGCLVVSLLSGVADASDAKLVEAAKQKNMNAVIALLKQHADPNSAEGDGTTALFWAAYNNDEATLDRLVAAGADINKANEYGATALYVAAMQADAALVEKLLKAGAKANLALLSGETPLMEAARRGKAPVVQLLLNAGADPNTKESQGGQTALMWAAAEKHADVVEILVRNKADINEHSKGESSALMFAAQQGDADSIRVLLDAGTDVNERIAKSGLTPLLVASAMYHEAAVAMLLDHGANPDATTADGFTPLHYAAWHRGTIGIVNLLLEHKANPNVRLVQEKPTTFTESILTLQGATPLLMAADVNNIDVVRALVAAGADPSIPTVKNTTALMLASGGGTFKANPRPPEERAVAIETVTFLVGRGVDVNATGQYGYTALHAASYQGLNDVIVYLAQHGAKLDTKDSFGQTPLSIANAVITKAMVDYQQAPHLIRKETADLLLSLGATPLERSGVVQVAERAKIDLVAQ